jgi:hypothetical protein
VAALRPHLARECSLTLVDAEPASPPEADLDVFHVADHPAHGFVYRALRARPGLVVLEDWSLHRLVHAETAGRGDAAAYLREARRAHGETGLFVARQVLRGLGGELLPALFALNDRVLEASLALVAATEYVRRRAAARRPGPSVVHVPLHLEGLPPLPAPAEARAALGLSVAGPVVAALRPPGGGAPRERTHRALERLGAALVRTSDDDPRRAEHLAAADLVVALEYPSRGAVPAVVASALAAGRPTLVSAGSAAAAEFPAGVVVPVSPGPTEAAEVEALGHRLLEDAPLRARVGALARAWVQQRTGPARAAGILLAVAREALAHKEEALRARTAASAAEATLAGWAMEEVRWGARDLGLSGLDRGLEKLVGELLR